MPVLDNLPPGSMRGSGVYTYDVTRWDICGADLGFGDMCLFEGDVDITINDFGLGGWECPRCGTQHEVDEADLYDDRDDYYEDRDRDEAYEDAFYDD